MKRKNNTTITIIILALIIFLVLKTYPRKEIIDDLNPNYVRGKITFDGNPAPAGTKYTITVIAGPNTGYSYTGEVDDAKVPPFLKGKGYYSTDDQIGFSTGATFKVTVENCNQYATGVFQTGGNGCMGESCTEGVNINCVSSQNITVSDGATTKIISDGKLNFKIIINTSKPYYNITLRGSPSNPQKFNQLINGMGFGYTDKNQVRTIGFAFDIKEFVGQTITFQVEVFGYTYPDNKLESGFSKPLTLTIR